MCKITTIKKEIGTYSLQTNYENNIVDSYTLSVKSNFNINCFFRFEPQDFHKIEIKISDIEKKLSIISILESYNTNMQQYGYFGKDMGISEDYFEDISDDIISKFNL